MNQYNFFQATNFFVADLTASGDGEQKTVSQDDEANTTRLDLETLRLGHKFSDKYGWFKC